MHALFGFPPRELAPVPPGATQLSPLVPGAAELEALGEASLDSCVLLAPPGTLERRYALALIIRALKPGSPLLALGPKDKGGARIRKELEAFGCAVEEESRAHHKLCRTTRPVAPLNLEEAIRDGAPRFLPELGLWTQPGVFSWDRPDPGSALLLAHLPALEGTGADFGAGLGVLSRAAFGSAKVEKITLLELDRRALACARKNLGNERRASFLQADLRKADLLRDFGVHGLDFILMNPPFHDAGAEDRSLGLRFLAQAAHALSPAGSLWLVANRHLPYEELLRESFSAVRLVAEEGGFKVYEATR